MSANVGARVVFESLLVDADEVSSFEQTTTITEKTYFQSIWTFVLDIRKCLGGYICFYRSICLCVKRVCVCFKVLNASTHCCTSLFPIRGLVRHTQAKHIRNHALVFLHKWLTFKPITAWTRVVSTWPHSLHHRCCLKSYTMQILFPHKAPSIRYTHGCIGLVCRLLCRSMQGALFVCYKH